MVVVKCPMGGGHPVIARLKRICPHLPSIVCPITSSSAPRLSLPSLQPPAKTQMKGRQEPADMKPQTLPDQRGPGLGMPHFFSPSLLPVNLGVHTRLGGLSPHSNGGSGGLGLPSCCSCPGLAQGLGPSRAQCRPKSRE